MTPARSAYPELVAADAAIDEHAEHHPPYTASLDDYLAWQQRRDELVAARDAIYDRLRPLLCSRCHGHGITRYRHRHGGACYQCDGDGYSARGRRQDHA